MSNLLEKFAKLKKTHIPVSVELPGYAAPIEFPMYRDYTGDDVRDRALRYMNIRESWYFGLKYTDKRGDEIYLSMDKKLADSKIEEEVLRFTLRMIYIPKISELKETTTIRACFDQTRQQLKNRQIACPDAKLLSQLQDLEKAVESGQDAQDRTERQLMVQYLELVAPLAGFGEEVFPAIYDGRAIMVGVSNKGLRIYEPSDRFTAKKAIDFTRIARVAVKGKDSIEVSYVVKGSQSDVFKMRSDRCAESLEYFVDKQMQQEANHANRATDELHAYDLLLIKVMEEQAKRDEARLLRMRKSSSTAKK